LIQIKSIAAAFTRSDRSFLDRRGSDDADQHRRGEGQRGSCSMTRDVMLLRTLIGRARGGRQVSSTSLSG
jgi:hypothetical protein